MEHVGKTVSNETEVIDGNHYEECRFENCKMIYRGGEIPRITRCQFEDCKWHFEDAAERTLLFMRQLYHGMGPGGMQLIESTITQLRQPSPPDPDEPKPSN